ncbi:MAG: hypothetical protein HZA52_08865 [Planctomycetes bacterium]|nr:hypothetical protein [Planctomycetota bacterium]
MNLRIPLSIVLVAASAFAQAPAEQKPAAVRLGSGAHVYEWDVNWGKRPDGKDLGNTHGCVAVDSKGRIYFNTDTEDAVMVFEADGTFVTSWGREFRGGLHGMTVVKEEKREVLYLAHTGRHEVVKATLEGEVLRSFGYPAMSGIYTKPEEFNPTSVVVAPSGEMFVADGYGKSWVHKYDALGNYVKSFGGPGTEPGKMQTPHGLLIDTRGAKPTLVVADRENSRLQTFDLDGKLLGVVDHDLRRPCNVALAGTDLAVPDLAGRVTIFDKDDKLVCQLGDNPDESLRAQNGVERGKWKTGEFLSPHGAAWDAQGNLYVLDWNFLGRVTKLARVR